MIRLNYTQTSNAAKIKRGEFCACVRNIISFSKNSNPHSFTCFELKRVTLRIVLFISFFFSSWNHHHVWTLSKRTSFQNVKWNVTQPYTSCPENQRRKMSHSSEQKELKISAFFWMSLCLSACVQQTLTVPRWNVMFVPCGSCHFHSHFSLQRLLPVTTLWILVMKLLTVLMGTPSVSSWIRVTMSSIWGGKKLQSDFQ